MTPDQINQTALEIAEEAIIHVARRGWSGWPTLDPGERLSDDDEKAVSARLHEIAEEVASRG